MRIEKERTPAGKDDLAIKTGKGGLMDAEFIAQTLCLENGWQEANTLRALERGRERACSAGRGQTDCRIIASCGGSKAFCGGGVTKAKRFCRMIRRRIIASRCAAALQRRKRFRQDGDWPDGDTSVYREVFTVVIQTNPRWRFAS